MAKMKSAVNKSLSRLAKNTKKRLKVKKQALLGQNDIQLTLARIVDITKSGKQLGTTNDILLHFGERLQAKSEHVTSVTIAETCGRKRRMKQWH